MIGGASLAQVHAAGRANLLHSSAPGLRGADLGSDSLAMCSWDRIFFCELGRLTSMPQTRKTNNTLLLTEVKKAGKVNLVY